ncbi:MAG: hypothetical protein QXI49_05525 [Candidatus Methanomethylicaceae archaeon]
MVSQKNKKLKLEDALVCRCGESYFLTKNYYVNIVHFLEEHKKCGGLMA